MVPSPFILQSTAQTVEAIQILYYNICSIYIWPIQKMVVKSQMETSQEALPPFMHVSVLEYLIAQEMGLLLL